MRDRPGSWHAATWPRSDAEIGAGADRLFAAAVPCCLRSWCRFSLLLALPLMGCSVGDDAQQGEAAPLLVMAPSSMAGAMTALVESYEVDNDAEVDLVLGATGNLASQLENGAPADVFFSADEATVDRLIESGNLSGASRRLYARGSLVLVWASAITEPPGSLNDLKDERFSLIAIANPELAPYGAAALQALRASGVLPSVEGRIVMGDNIAQAYQFVATGNADAALVARSVAVQAGDTLRLLPVDPALHAPILHAAALVEPVENPLAEHFLGYATGREAAAIMLRSGFSPPPSQ